MGLVFMEGGLFLVKVVPYTATLLNDSPIYQASILIAVCLLLMMSLIVFKLIVLRL